MARQESVWSSFFSYGWKYDVFLSFRGEDTRRGFTGYLYKALHDRGIDTFIDDKELQRGEEITQSLLRAIEESRIAIIVFSKNYASSPFCLNELVHILHCIKETGRLVLPVFYNVDPSHVRHQRGSYAEALATLEERFKDDMEKVHKWKMALRQAANLAGFHFKLGNENEYEFIEKIVKVVSNNINGAPLHVKESKAVQILMQPSVRRFVSVVSYVIGFVCLGLSSSLRYLIQEWIWWKMVVYVIASIIILVGLVSNKRKRRTSPWNKPHFVTLSLITTFLYWFFWDKFVKVKPDTYILISSAAFAIMSLSLEIETHCGEETDLLSFFSATLTAQLMKIRINLFFVGAFISFCLFKLRAYIDANADFVLPVQNDTHLADPLLPVPVLLPVQNDAQLTDPPLLPVQIDAQLADPTILPVQNDAYNTSFLLMDIEDKMRSVKSRLARRRYEL